MTQLELREIKLKNNEIWIYYVLVFELRNFPGPEEEKMNSAQGQRPKIFLMETCWKLSLAWIFHDNFFPQLKLSEFFEKFMENLWKIPS